MCADLLQVSGPPTRWCLPARPRLPCLPTSLACLALSFSRLSPLNALPVLRFPSPDSPRSLPCLSCAFLLSTLPAHCLACLALSFSRLSPLTASPPTASSGQPRHRCLAAVPCRSCRLCPSPPSQLQAVSLAAIAAAGCVPRRHRSRDRRRMTAARPRSVRLVATPGTAPSVAEDCPTLSLLSPSCSFASFDTLPSLALHPLAR